MKADVSMIESVEAVDPTLVRIHLNRPDSSLVQILGDRAGMMVSPTAAADPVALGEHPVGTGPYTFAEWVPATASWRPRTPSTGRTASPTSTRSRSASSRTSRPASTRSRPARPTSTSACDPRASSSSSRSRGSNVVSAVAVARGLLLQLLQATVRRCRGPARREPGDRPRGVQRGLHARARPSPPCRPSPPRTTPTRTTSTTPIRTTRNRRASCSPRPATRTAWRSRRSPARRRPRR